jgi:1,2-phenylacetyl-CoA epoxidase PaaB subunit
VSVPDAGRVYEVFARGRQSDALAHVGTVRAPGDGLARAYARTTYDEEPWAEMLAVPREAVVRVMGPGGG